MPEEAEGGWVMSGSFWPGSGAGGGAWSQVPTHRCRRLDVQVGQDPVGHQAEGFPAQLGVHAAHEGMEGQAAAGAQFPGDAEDRKSTRLNSSHVAISYAVF